MLSKSLLQNAVNVYVGYSVAFFRSGKRGRFKAAFAATAGCCASDLRSWK